MKRVDSLFADIVMQVKPNHAGYLRAAAAADSENYDYFYTKWLKNNSDPEFITKNTMVDKILINMEKLRDYAISPREEEDEVLI